MATTKVIPAGKMRPHVAPAREPAAPKPRPLKQTLREKAAKSAMNLLSVRQEGNPMHIKMLEFLDGRIVTVIMTIFTIYALFGDDLRLALFPSSADPVFFSLSLVALVLFFLELTLNSIAKRNYLWRFYFWLDLMATLSLVPDIGWFWDPIVSAFGSDSDTGAGTSAIQAGRASRAGTRAGRIVRIVRLVRLIRIVKLYKHVGKHNKKEGKEVATEPSQVGKVLADLTTRRLIVLVLAMVILLPFFNPSGLDDTTNQYQTFGLSTLHRLRFGSGHPDAFYNHLREYVRESGDLLSLELYGVSATDMDSWLRALTFVDGSGNNVTTSPSTEWSAADLCDVATIEANFRSNEFNELNVYGCFDYLGYPTAENAANCRSRAWFSNKDSTVYEAAMNMGKTVFVMLILSAGAIMFTKIAEHLVIGPIERMVNMVKQLAEDPLASVKHHHRDHTAARSTYETALLETTLAKIGGLLQIGFGEAGTEIIRQNMSNGGTLNPLIAGRKMTGIFGFCDIRQFTDATECLQEEVMVFVNRIGDIVHFATHQYTGAANKNIGDAFLLVWRMPADEVGDPLMDASMRGSARNTNFGIHASHDTLATVVNVAPTTDSKPRQFLPDRDGAGLGHFAAHSSRASNVTTGTHMESKDLGAAGPISATQLADNALFAFLKIVVDIANSNQHGELRQYRTDARLVTRFPKGYSVKMGYGLHLGWAIEGAIGSKLKIDASYLSPNVNMASRLEAATKQYGTPILMSHQFTNCLSPAAHRLCRQIDRVTVKGSKEPVDLYTFDVSDIPDTLGLRNKYARAIAHFDGDPNVTYLQKSIDRGFYGVFEEGLRHYLEGNWTDAAAALERAAVLKPGDGPTATLLKVMKKTDLQHPEDWDGVRELTDK